MITGPGVVITVPLVVELQLRRRPNRTNCTCRATGKDTAAGKRMGTAGRPESERRSALAAPRKGAFTAGEPAPDAQRLRNHRGRSDRRARARAGGDTALPASHKLAAVGTQAAPCRPPEGVGGEADVATPNRFCIFQSSKQQKWCQQEHLVRQQPPLPVRHEQQTELNAARVAKIVKINSRRMAHLVARTLDLLCHFVVATARKAQGK